MHDQRNRWVAVSMGAPDAQLVRRLREKSQLISSIIPLFLPFCVSLFVSLCLCLFILTFISLILCQALYICIRIPSSPALRLSLSAYISVICAFVSIGSSLGNISVHLIDWSLHIAPSDQASDDRNHYIHMYTNHRYIIIPVGPIVGLCRP